MKIAGCNISQSDYDVLAYLVEDPQQWVEHAVASFPPAVAAQHIANKIQAARTVHAGRRDARRRTEHAELNESPDRMRLERELALTALRAQVAVADGLPMAQDALKRQIAALEVILLE